MQKLDESDPSRHSAIFPRDTEEMALMLAITDQTLLIWGEPGTGKEFLARFIHRRSFRAERPFVTIELADLPWYVAPVQQWPKRWKSGSARPPTLDHRMLEVAGGTLCISRVDDEIAWNQGTLLSFLERPIFRDLSGEEFEPDVRLILLSDRDLSEGVRDRWFRRDLYFRLSDFSLHLLPLRERQGEMRQIVASLMRSSREFLGDEQSEMLDERELEYLCRYHWPGNLRELQSLLADVGIFSGGGRNLERWISARMV